MKLICIRHPQYDGSGSPVLSCKTCCSLYISNVKAKNSGSSEVDTKEWLREKSREAEQALGGRSSSGKGAPRGPDFNPWSI